jgi:hypothetical protein
MFKLKTQCTFQIDYEKLLEYLYYFYQNHFAPTII